ncbi:MAG TPA: DUF1570 domain-containing protein [Caulobacteraceae bacterium]|jgi:hypothetical protein
MRSPKALAGLALAVALAAGAGSAEAKWLKAESPQFIVYGEGDEASLREFVRRLEVFDSVLREKNRLKAASGAGRKLPIYLVNNHDEFRRVVLEAKEGMRGVYARGNEDVFAVAIRTRGENHVLLHEYTHHFMHRHFPSAYPGWLVEGMAEYFSGVELSPGMVTLGMPQKNRVDWLSHNSWIPIETVLRARSGELKTDDERAMYYAQSWLLTHYMMSNPQRTQQLQAYMRAVAEQGADPVKALETATGTPAAQLQATLKTYVKGNGMTVTRLIGKETPPAVTITALPASADDLLLEDRAAVFGIPTAERQRLLQTVRSRAAKHAGDRLAEVTLARWEIAYGDRAAGEAILKRRAQAEPKDAELWRMLASSRMAAAEAETDPERRRAMVKEAQEHATAAMRANPEQSYQTLLTFVQSRSGMPGYPQEIDMDALLAAYDAAPEVAAVRLQAARALLRKGRGKEAAAVLAPLLNDPHGGKAMAAARGLLEQALAAQGAAGK